jgi:uncharacterized membrane protein YjgN (DUF898 family)
MTEPTRELTLKFNGSAREYFRIWIVNLCLSLLTLGIFSAWAKVRKKRYFYSHTLIDGTPFQYLGRPIPILKGRIIAAVAFSAYYLSNHIFTSFLPYVLVAGTVLAPWVIVRSAAFNARYSAYRNMTFRFDGGYGGAVKQLYAWGLIPAVIIAGSFKGLSRYPMTAVVAAAFTIFGLLFPWWIKRFKGFIIGHTSYGDRKGEFSATGGQFFKIYFSAGLLLFLAAILVGILEVTIFSFSKESQVPALLGSIPLYVGYVLAYAYVKARGSNLSWNQTRLGPLRFESTLRPRALAKLYLTNTLAIIASVGTLIPWAVMRTLKYRADNLHVLLQSELTDFKGSEAGDVRAIGEELGDFFDVDLSL